MWISNGTDAKLMKGGRASHSSLASVFLREGVARKHTERGTNKTLEVERKS